MIWAGTTVAGDTPGGRREARSPLPELEASGDRRARHAAPVHGRSAGRNVRADESDPGRPRGRRAGAGARHLGGLMRDEQAFDRGCCSWRSRPPRPRVRTAPTPAQRAGPAAPAHRASGSPSGSRRSSDLTDEQAAKLRETSRKFGGQRRELAARERAIRAALVQQLRRARGQPGQRRQADRGAAGAPGRSTPQSFREEMGEISKFLIRCSAPRSHHARAPACGGCTRSAASGWRHRTACYEYRRRTPDRDSTGRSEPCPLRSLRVTRGPERIDFRVPNRIPRCADGCS